VHHADPFDW
jgi:PhzF family phenazine biosynthesis protein